MKNTVDKKDLDTRIHPKKYAGVSVDIADDEKVDEWEVKQETCILNNNPRNND